MSSDDLQMPNQAWQIYLKQLTNSKFEAMKVV
jgi:hypothetical protein